MLLYVCGSIVGFIGLVYIGLEFANMFELPSYVYFTISGSHFGWLIGFGCCCVVCATLLCCPFRSMVAPDNNDIESRPVWSAEQEG